MRYVFEPETGNIYAYNSCAVEAIAQISLLAIDYDGVGNSIEGLRDLVDEMQALAKEAIGHIYDNKIFPDADAELKSKKIACEQACASKGVRIINDI